MNLSVGIVGLPNVGKSTLFNALLKKQQALVANYPFATIEPNVGVVAVPDSRLEKLAEVVAGVSTSEEPWLRKLSLSPSEVSKMPPIIPVTVKFVDIAGLVKGAHEGAGLGNKFLSHIREVAIIAHVVRAFTDENVIKEGSVEPKTDYETIRTELQLADLETLEKQKEPRGGASKEELHRWSAIKKIKEALNQGKDANTVVLTDEEEKEADQLFLLSAKPEIVVLNVSEEDYTKSRIEPIINQYTSILVVPKEKITVISAKIESELASLTEDEQKEYLKDLGLHESGLERLIKKAYETLGLISFLTAGEKEVRAWTIKKGTNAQNAAGVIHTDFIKNFIKAEIVSFDDFVGGSGPARHASQLAGVAGRGWKGAREKGKTRLEGKDYIMQEGDVVEFKVGR